MARKRIGILTGGGDVPGLNAIIKTVTYRGSENYIEVVGLRRGWEALTHLNLEDSASRSHYLIPLNRENTRTIDRRGGTILHSSRTNPSKMQKLPDHLVGQEFPVSQSTKGGVATKTWDLTGQVLANLSGLDVEHLIAIGGDDTLGYAAKLNELGVKIIAIPKTMDNDVRNTEYCIGFSTAITRASDAIQRQRTTVGSHERIGIFRVFGRDAGFTALFTAYARFLVSWVTRSTLTAGPSSISYRVTVGPRLNPVTRASTSNCSVRCSPPPEGVLQADGLPLNVVVSEALTSVMVLTTAPVSGS